MADKLADKADISEGEGLPRSSTSSSQPRTGEGIIAVELDAGRKVNITGFGNFSHQVIAQPVRAETRPPGQTITIAAKNYAHFAASKGLKDRVADLRALNRDSMGPVSGGVHYFGVA